MTSRLRLLFLALACTIGIAACDRASGDAPAASSGTSSGAVAQHFEISIDGRRMTLSPDDPDSSVVVLGLVGGSTISLGAMDKGKDLSFTLVVSAERIVPGSYEAYACFFNARCKQRTQSALIAPYPTGRPDVTGHMAYDHPELGLSPAVLTITRMDDAYWPGVGPSKRIQGSFKGEFANLDRGPDSRDRIVGKVRKVEGTFDLYAMLR